MSRGTMKVNRGGVVEVDGVSDVVGRGQKERIEENRW